MGLIPLPQRATKREISHFTLLRSRGHKQLAEVVRTVIAPVVTIRCLARCPRGLIRLTFFRSANQFVQRDRHYDSLHQRILQVLVYTNKAFVYHKIPNRASQISGIES